jgi:hypothetical protein
MLQLDDFSEHEFELPQSEFFLTFVTVTVISGALGRTPLISRSKNGI